MVTGVFDRYAYPGWLRTHSTVVGRVAQVLAEARRAAGDDVAVEDVVLAAYLHDIGRSPLLSGAGREHNELSALVLAAEGLVACVEPALRHPVYSVLDPRIAPRTLAEKIVYLADRRGGMRVVSVEERSRETAQRHPRYALAIARATGLARGIEAEVFHGLPFGPADLAAKLEATR